MAREVLGALTHEEGPEPGTESTPLVGREEVAADDAGTKRPPSGPRERFSQFAVLLVGVAMFLTFAALVPGTFASAENLKAMVNSQAIVLLLALAATWTLRAGDFDLSISAVMALAGAVMAVLSSQGHAWWIAALIAVGVGVLVGAFNAFMVVIIGVDSIISSLGVFTVLGGLTYAVSDSRVVVGLPAEFVSAVRHQTLGLPSITWLAWFAVLVLWYVYEKTPFGRYLLFVGGNREASRLAGLPVRRIRAVAFVAGSVMAAFTGVLLAGFLGAMDPGVGPQYLLQPFAAAFLGATTIYVGRFNALGTLVGIYLLVIGITGLQLLGVAPWVSDVFNGAALVLAVGVARMAAVKRS